MKAKNKIDSKETNKNDKSDIKNKYYELGWFSTKINEVKINSLKDICGWIKAMCELAKTGWKRQLWGARKKDDRGMLGILNVCQKDNAFNNVKDLPHGIFDCVNLKNLLDKINECVRKTSRGRTKQPGFTNSWTNCVKFLNAQLKPIRKAGDALQKFIKELKVPKVDNDAMYSLGGCVYNFGEPMLTSNIDFYKTYAGLTNDFFKKIIEDKKIEVGINPQTGTWLEFARQKIDYLCENTNYWIIKEILEDPLAKALENNCKKISEGLKDKTIKLKEIKKN